jgi:hypothetical protein
MTKSTLAAKYRSLMVRKSHKKSIMAVAHKMIRLIYPDAQPTPALYRPGHRLRGHEREEERAALDQAAQDDRPLAVAKTRCRQRTDSPLNSRGRAQR